MITPVTARKISVIISTKDRAHAIGPCLDSVLHSFQAADYQNGEIVVVDNASSDDTAQVLKAWAALSTIPVAIVYEAKRGLSAARNAGIRAATGDLLVFTDDDCRLGPTYIAEALRYDAADGAENVMRSGSVILGDPTDLPLTIKSVTETRSWQRPMDIVAEGNLLGGALIGCNMVMRKAIATQIGEFDEKLGAGTKCCAAEDTDYFYRAYLKGIRLEMVPDLILSHYHGRKTQAQKTKLLESYAIGNGALAIKYLFIYPTFSRHIYWHLKKCFQRGARHQYNLKDGNLTDIRSMIFQLKGIRFYISEYLKSRSLQNSQTG